ncbi:MAG: undecaprenyl-diphosphate phosphatase [Deltaproteobacteria bacterium]|nr:undecaprenyl-diphosphate phosphatase [Deltaproteobacteria bacterium]
MNFFTLVVLAVIQGVTELLPVSSSAHVIMAERLMGLDPGAPDMTFLLVMLHTGTMGAVLVYFWPRWRRLLTADSRFSFVKMVVLATVWTGVIGLVLKVMIEKIVLERIGGYDHAEVEQLFRNLPLIGLSVFAVGLVILRAEGRATSAGRTQVNGKQATLIGVVQALCLPFRGFSRSGATISTALRCGLSRSLAEDFSFALAVLITPPVVALELQRLWHSQAEAAAGGMAPGQGLSVVPGVIGMALSFGAGLVALYWLSAVLERGRWRYFGYYCLLASAVVLLAHFVWGL